jgi:hypothetical protein
MDDQWLWLKELRRVLKEDWANLWKTKHDDEVKAEGISVDDFDMLFVDRGIEGRSSMRHEISSLYHSGRS